MVINQINTVLRQALLTFSNIEGFASNLEVLRKVLSNTTETDVNLHPQFKSEAWWMTPGKAPVSYIGIYENDILTMGIFLLRPGMKIPLHDHPQMYGLVKVIMGEVRISSFSVTEVENTYPVILNAKREPDIYLDSQSDVCILEPITRNIHEIESVNGPAAFLDILSPPYSTRTANNMVRTCTYFRVLQNLGGNVYNLRQTPTPQWFWNDSFDYTGPELLTHGKSQTCT